jgi:hypothetical protein
LSFSTEGYSMQKVFAIADKIINKIPLHLQDLIKKAFLAVFLLFSLIAILKGISMGTEDLGPPGIQLIKKNSDLFINDQLREENRNKIEIIEEVTLESDSVIEFDIPSFQSLSSEKSGKILSEDEDIELDSDFLRRKRALNLIDPEQVLLSDSNGNASVLAEPKKAGIDSDVSTEESLNIINNEEQIEKKAEPLPLLEP